MFRFLLVAAVAALACGGARAATCPDQPPPVVKFVALPSDVERDTSKSAKELAALDAATKPLPSRYEDSLSSSSARSMTLVTNPDGSVCASLKEVDLKFGFKRKIYVAQEFAGDACVAETIAAYQMPLVKADDDALAAFGAALAQTYGADVTAIGTGVGPNKDEAQKPLLDKMSALVKDKIFPAFSKQVVDGETKADRTLWKADPCGGATDKAFASINGSASDMKTQPAIPQQQQPAPRSSMGAGRY
jgi:hypothetical protein